MTTEELVQRINDLIREWMGTSFRFVQIEKNTVKATVAQAIAADDVARMLYQRMVPIGELTSADFGRRIHFQLKSDTLTVTVDA